MPKTITVELSHSSIRSALKGMEEYKRYVLKKYDEVCYKLAVIGAEEARKRFAMGDYGNNDVTVLPPVKIPNGYKIVANGKDVYFIEFGTGDQVSTHYDTSVPVAWGTWSAEHDQVLWNLGYWYYEGEKLTGTKAQMPMYYAARAIRENEKRVVREVFGK